MNEQPYNPLDKLNLGKSVANAVLERFCSPLPPETKFFGAGIYAIYYHGDFQPYAPLSKKNQGEKCEIPIYIGKAVPPGARKGGFGLGLTSGNVLYKRLVEHAKSIEQAENLELSDFRCRYLTAEDIWIPLGEQLLIEMFSPIWNKLIDGYGNHDPGKGRYNQQRSLWDVVHPGRPWAQKLATNTTPYAQVLKSIASFMENYGK